MAVMAKHATKSTPQDDDSDEEWITRSVKFPPALYEKIKADAKKARRSAQLQFIWMLEELYRLQEESGE